MFPSLATMKTIWLTTKSKKSHKQVIEKGREGKEGKGFKGQGEKECFSLLCMPVCGM